MMPSASILFMTLMVCFIPILAPRSAALCHQTHSCRASGTRSVLALLARARREPEVEIARLERLFVLLQALIVRRHRHGEAGRQPADEQAGALELVEPGQVA